MAVEKNMKDKRVLITGAGGSIGSELCHQVADLLPSELIVLSHSELPLYRITNELRQAHPGVIIIPVLADVRSARRMTQVFEIHRPQVVIHAAAIKHVPMAEDNPHEAIQTNIWGTRNVCQASIESGAEQMIFISTDKAVEPNNVMGATKRMAELYLMSRMRKKSHTLDIKIVRFGNVWGSSGSVVPLFIKQIENHGPVTVTDARVERYFMSVADAVKLVLLAAEHGPSLYVLNMGEPRKIRDIAQQLIAEYMNAPNHPADCLTPIEIIYTGLRPGEKITEELFRRDENPVPITANGKLRAGVPKLIPHEHMLHQVNVLHTLAEHGHTRAAEILFDTLMMLEDADG